MDLLPRGESACYRCSSGRGVPHGIAAGPDGNLWFTELGANQIGRVTTSGAFREFPIPTAGSYADGIAAGPDGNLWFTEFYGNKIGVVRPSTTTGGPSMSTRLS